MTQISIEEVIDWAKNFLRQADMELTADELKEQKKLASLVQTPEYKTFLSRMLDESSQIRDNQQLNKRVRKIIKKYGIPDFFNNFNRLLIRMYMTCGHRFPSLAMPIFKRKLRRETKKIIIAEERPELTKHLAERAKSQIGQNVNLLGEVVLGDVEAENRYQHYLMALEEPDINNISIKLSGIYAQIHSLSYRQNKEELCKLLANIYQKAFNFPYVDSDGMEQPKFVNLDMEEYKDAALTLDVFMEVMSRPEFKHYTAGIALQAYMPDTYGFYLRLLDFAKNRVAEGGAPIKVRLVKGANLQMESIISSSRGWSNPVYPSKAEVDANYLHILDTALLPENAKVCHIGVASHNYFSIGYAYLLAERNGVSEYLTFEMLEGMANNLPRVMRKLEKQILLYTPVVKANHFLNAIAYLVRRLDENTGKENFLSYTFNLKLASSQWNFLADQFKTAYNIKDTIHTIPFRQQNRNEKSIPVKDFHTFENEPDTDLDLPQNRAWALDVLKKWETSIDFKKFIVPVQTGNREFFTDNKKIYYDRSRNDEVAFCEANLSSMTNMEKIIEIAERDLYGWRKTPLEKRNKILHKVAENLSENRGDLIGCMAAITGKTFTEGDVEVSEAIDFCRFYPISMKVFEELQTVTYKPKGIILVISPWNFPLAIPVGGVAAALAGGNSVILKPATVALPVAWQFAKCFWDAGVPKDALQVVCPVDRTALNYLTLHPSIKHIILTGGTDTAFSILEQSPRTPLSAETGGKNAIIITGCADLDHAILNAVSSAFSNAGQKCSACSLLLVDKKTYNNASFQSKLKDAVTSLRTGSVWDTMNYVGPMVDNQNEKLLHAIENLEEGESWLVAPEFLDKKKYILKPTVKWGVKPDSYTFKTELFAPLLSVVCIDNLEQGVAYANSSEYGLTAGLQSLNEEEHTYWKNHIEAGNLYINRGITGAIVRRQPFGGMKRSAFGGGIKTGGPNYVSCFVEFSEKQISETERSTTLSDLIQDENDKNRINFAFSNYKKIWIDEFSQERDVSHIYGEENIFRYLPVKNIGLRVYDDDNLADVFLIMIAANTANTSLTVSISENHPKLAVIRKAVSALAGIKKVIQEEAGFIEDMEKYERIRVVSTKTSDALYQKAAQLGKYLADRKPLVEGRVELLHYLKEQSISYEYHRYGSIFEK